LGDAGPTDLIEERIRLKLCSEDFRLVFVRRTASKVRVQPHGYLHDGQNGGHFQIANGRSRFVLASASLKFRLKQSMWSLLKEFLKFSKQEKKWWLIPLIVILLLLGTILIFTASSGIVWALYPFL
jgi:hypothetical protein